MVEDEELEAIEIESNHTIEIDYLRATHVRSTSAISTAPTINQNVSNCIFSLTRLIGYDSVAA